MKIIDSCFEPIQSLGKEIRFGIYATQSGAVARLRIPMSLEGHPGLGHGGVIALLFDEVMGWAAANTNNSPAFTQRLKVTYVSPTRIGEYYRMEARVESIGENKLTVIAEITDDDGGLVASATGLFHCISENGTDITALQFNNSSVISIL